MSKIKIIELYFFCSSLFKKIFFNKGLLDKLKYVYSKKEKSSWFVKLFNVSRNILLLFFNPFIMLLKVFSFFCVFSLLIISIFFIFSFTFGNKLNIFFICSLLILIIIDWFESVFINSCLQYNKKLLILVLLASVLIICSKKEINSRI